MYADRLQSQGLRHKKFGNMHCIFYDKSIILSIGPHWIFVFAFNTVILTVHMLFIFVIFHDFFWLKVLAFLFFTLLQVCYLICALQNPGILYPNLEIDLGESRYCCKCGAVGGGFHCSICEVCILGFDHHCGFIGKCVGKGNINSFYALLISTFLTICFMVLSLAWKAYNLKRSQEGP